MSVALSRKRSRLAIDEDDEEIREPSPTIHVLSDTLKRSRTQCELDELDIIDAEDAWRVDVDAILASKRIARPLHGRLEAHDNWQRYSKGDSIVVLCVQGNVHTHYDLLWYERPMLSLSDTSAYVKQLSSPRPILPLALPTSLRPLPRSPHTQSVVHSAVFASSHTSGLTVKQPLCPFGPFASPWRRQVSAGRVGSARPEGQTEACSAVWLGRWQTRSDACWREHTNEADGSAGAVYRDTGGREMMIVLRP